MAASAVVRIVGNVGRVQNALLLMARGAQVSLILPQQGGNICGVRVVTVGAGSLREGVMLHGPELVTGQFSGVTGQADQDFITPQGL